MTSKNSKLVNISDSLFLQPHKPGEKVMLSSRTISEVFGKRHDNIIRDINNLQCSREFKQLNFEGNEYLSEKGIRKEYLCTRDGFMLLAMGFTGREAMRFKEELINRFNFLERYYLEQEAKYLRSMKRQEINSIHAMKKAGMTARQIKRKLKPTPEEEFIDGVADLCEIFGV